MRRSRRGATRGVPVPRLWPAGRSGLRPFLRTGQRRPLYSPDSHSTWYRKREQANWPANEADSYHDGLTDTSDVVDFLREWPRDR